MDVLLASPRGFCAGVDRAIAIVEGALERFGAPVYVRHEIVHNRHVVDELRRRGAVFIEDPAEAPPGAVLVFSAHGVSPAVREVAAARALRVIDATCPLVTKVHVEVAKMRAQGREIVMIGHEGHPEVEGTMGQTSDGMYLVQTVDDVERKAALQPAGADADAAGEAEVEFAKNAPTQQEIEFSVHNLAAGTSVTFLIDGQVIGRAAVDRRGRAGLEIDVPLSGAAVSR